MTDDAPTSAEVLRGIEGVEAADPDEGGSSSWLPFDPREDSPKDVYRNSKTWVRERRYWVAAAIGLLVAIGAYRAYVGLDPVPVGLDDVPPWGWVGLAAGIPAAPVAVWGGLKVGRVLNPSKGKLVSQLDAMDGGQELLRISEDRYRDLRVLDYTGTERPRDYLKEVSVNGESAVEVDAYYPTRNVAVAAWQAGATNHDIRKHEHETRQIKTEQDRRANEGLKASMEKPQEVAAEVRKHSNVLVGAVEGVVTPGEVDLAALSDQLDDEEMDPSDDHLAELESGHELLGGRETRGDGESGDGVDSDGTVGEAVESLTASLSALTNRDTNGDGDGGDR